MLTELYFPFSVIGLSETKIKFGEQPLTNIDLPGYTFVSQNTLSNAGGVGFYVRNDYNLIYVHVTIDVITIISQSRYSGFRSSREREELSFFVFTVCYLKKPWTKMQSFPNCFLSLK